MFQKAKDVMMTIGSSVAKKSKELYDGFINKVRDTAQKVESTVSSVAVAVKERAIEGEWLPKSMFASGTAVITLASTSSMAAIDVSSALTTFGDVNTAIPLVGAAFLAALGILAAWKLIRGAFA
ncbi:MAG: hypothetical protein E6Q59_02015 [Nitrosomonas sp.]|nr:major capsid protein [Nitrosomonas sp.]OQW80781.1 MAG: hypothetical protein BVN30_12670 [Proteobacteria bacterium ST_bin16]TXI41532.1 MAG: hypothetical protein E6Q59_02015 [Nitrosomonas sp.]